MAATPPPEHPTTAPADSIEVRRLLGRIRVVVGIAVAAGALLLAAALLLTGHAGEPALWLRYGAFVLVFAFLAGSLTSTSMVWALSRRVQDLTGLEPARRRALQDVVLRRTATPADDAEAVAAARYAALVAPLLTAQLIGAALLYAALALLAFAAPSWGSSPLWIAVLVILIIGVLLIVPRSIRRVARARAYARDHPAPPAAEPDAGASWSP
jgi:hypothetical protein